LRDQRGGRVLVRAAPWGKREILTSRPVPRSGPRNYKGRGDSQQQEGGGLKIANHKPTHTAAGHHRVNKSLKKPEGPIEQKKANNLQKEKNQGE